MTIELWTIYHEAKRPVRPAGGIVKQYVVHEKAAVLGSRFASMNCYYDAWRNGAVYHPDIIGFQAYRKHFNFHAYYEPGWKVVGPEYFYEYQDWLYKWGGGTIEDFLNKYDMIITPPFDLTAQGGLARDFVLSRSAEDWGAFIKVMNKNGEWNWNINHVTSHWFVCKWALFNEFMIAWWKVFKELEPCIKSLDAKGNLAYSTRALDFITERFFTLWLASRPDIRTKTLPLLISWDAR